MKQPGMSEGAIIRDIVDVVVSGLLATGHTILCADHPDHSSVPEINGRVPDIISRDPDGFKVLTAVETALTIGSIPTRDRFRALSIVRNDKTHFHIAVPESCLRTAKDLAREWNLDVDAWWSDRRY